MYLPSLHLYGNMMNAIMRSLTIIGIYIYISINISFHYIFTMTRVANICGVDMIMIHVGGRDILVA